jgi:tetratricopeptide (TPR) repeat protein
MLLANREAGEADALMWRLKALLDRNSRIGPVVRVGVFELQAATAKAAGTISTRKSALLAALVAKESHLGPDHPDLAKMLGRVANLIGGEEAEPLTARRLEILEKVCDSGDPRVTEALAERGIALFKVGKRDEALEFLERVSTTEIDSENGMLCFSYLGCLRRERGELELAEKAFRRERMILAKQGNEGLMASESDFNLAVVLETAGKHAAARAIFSELAREAGYWHEDDDHALVWLHHYAETLREQGLDGEAEPLLARVEGGIKKQVDRSKRNFLSSAVSSARFSAERGRESEAAEYLQLVLQFAFRFRKEKGHPFPEEEQTIEMFRGLLGNTGKSPSEIDAALSEMRRGAGLE